MSKLDYKALAGGLRLSSEKDKPEAPDADADEGEDKPGSLGAKAIAALKSGNGEAFEEAVKQICGV